MGVRDLDPAEASFIEAHTMPLVEVAAIEEAGASVAMTSALERIAAGADGAYFHLDLDVLDPEVAYVNPYQAPNGLSVEDVEAIIAAVAARLPLKSAAVTAYDAEHDPDGRGAAAALRLIMALISAASRSE